MAFKQGGGDSKSGGASSEALFVNSHPSRGLCFSAARVTRVRQIVMPFSLFTNLAASVPLANWVHRPVVGRSQMGVLQRFDMVSE